MSKYYAVRLGKKPGIYKSWDECKAQVHGYPGAIYKSFTSIDQAQAFMENVDNVNQSKSQAQIYVDGSYSNDLKIFGWGIVIISGSNVDEFYGYSENQDYQYRNVAGEIYGSVKAIEISLERGYKSIDLHYDYTGIRHWALGEWRRNNSLTQRYHDFMQDLKDKININFIKVKAHSGDEYNELADQLAKKAVEEGGEKHA